MTIVAKAMFREALDSIFVARDHLTIKLISNDIDLVGQARYMVTVDESYDRLAPGSFELELIINLGPGLTEAFAHALVAIIEPNTNHSFLNAEIALASGDLRLTSGVVGCLTSQQLNKVPAAYQVLDEIVSAFKLAAQHRERGLFHA